MQEFYTNILPQLLVEQRTNRRTRKASGGRTPKWRTAQGEGEREGEGLAARLAGDLKRRKRKWTLFPSFLPRTHSLVHCSASQYQLFFALNVAMW